MSDAWITNRAEGRETMVHLAPVLQLLFQFDAKWNPDSLLEHHMTPYHLICLSAGDHHDLFEFLIQSSQRILVHAEDYYEDTALMYVVENANINCLRILITYGAEVKLDKTKEQAIFLAFAELQYQSKHSSSFLTEMFDLLQDNVVDVNKALSLAIALDSVECMKKLIAKAANLDNDDGYVWGMLSEYGRVDLLKCLLDHGIDKDVTDKNGRSLLW